MAERPWAIAAAMLWALPVGCHRPAETKARATASARSTTTAIPAPPSAPRPPRLPALAPLRGAPGIAGHDGPMLSPAARKRHAVETCFYGALGIAYAGDAYWASLGAEEPSAVVVPRFGAYPEHAPRRPGGRVPLAAKMGRLPFEAHARACAGVGRVKGAPAFGTVDDALAPFATYTTKVLRSLTTASRYFAREEYRRDDMKRGRALHVELSDELKRFDALHRALGDALATWTPPAVPEDAAEAPASQAIAAVIREARPLVFAAVRSPMAPAPVVAKLKPLQDARHALAKIADDTPAARLALRRTDALLALWTRDDPAPEAAGRRYRIGRRFALLLDGQRAAWVNAKGGGPRSRGAPAITPLGRPSARALKR